MTGLKIKDVADASGFSANTLRYYEQIGLLPESARTAAGYRVYDPRTLDRLAFIARAKHLGCTLDEITGLTTAWDGGQCGPVQDQLRQLVADKISAAQQQLAALMISPATFNTLRPHSNATDLTGRATSSAAASPSLMTPPTRWQRSRLCGCRPNRRPTTARQRSCAPCRLGR